MSFIELSYDVFLAERLSLNSMIIVIRSMRVTPNSMVLVNAAPSESTIVSARFAPNEGLRQ